MDQAMQCDGTFDASIEANKKLESNPTKTQLEEKRTVVQAELARTNKLPSNSSYAIHRVRVLNKVLHLLSIQRTVSQNEGVGAPVCYPLSLKMCKCQRGCFVDVAPGLM